MLARNTIFAQGWLLLCACLLTLGCYSLRFHDQGEGAVRQGGSGVPLNKRDLEHINAEYTKHLESSENQGERPAAQLDFFSESLPLPRHDASHTPSWSERKLSEE